VLRAIVPEDDESDYVRFIEQAAALL
jgi:hypothetical protein